MAINQTPNTVQQLLNNALNTNLTPLLPQQQQPSTTTGSSTNKPAPTIMQQLLMNNPNLTTKPNPTNIQNQKPQQQKMTTFNDNFNPVQNMIPKQTPSSTDLVLHGATSNNLGTNNMHTIPTPTSNVVEQLIHGNQNTNLTKPMMSNNSMHQRIKGDQFMFSSSVDNMMMKHIQATHTPDDRTIEVKPLLQIVQDIFHRATPRFDVVGVPTMQGHTETLEERTYTPNFISMLEALAFLIDRISSEIAYKCVSGGDAHATAMSILNLLSYYSWDAKVVLALAAFGVHYGEFWLVAQTYSSNQLAKSVAMLRQLPELLEQSTILKPRFEAIRNLINAMLDIARCIVEFSELPTQYITTDHAILSAAMVHVPIAVYWTIRSIVACAEQITGITSLSHEHMVSTTEAWELSSLAHKLNNMHSHLKGQLGGCYEHIDRKKYIESYDNLVRLFKMSHIDNMKVLIALIHGKDDHQPLVDGVTKMRVSIDVLKRKNVLLLISDLEISQEELSILEQIYNESRHHASRLDHPYEVVWLPVIDPAVQWTDVKQNQFKTLQDGMPWYTIHHPSLIDKAVVKFVKEDWGYGKKPILVVLDPQGRVACPNALHMMWIWGSIAFPFTTIREESLWNNETWGLELLVDGIDPVILNWMSEGRYICLYGGEDIEWIRKFTNSARTVAQASNIPLELVYVGRSNPKDRVRRNISTIMVEKLSHCWPDLTSIWYFWIRIESMWHSKHQLGKTSENDPIMHEIMSMLSFDSSEGGWAIISRGGSEMTKAKGNQFYNGLSEYSFWKDDVPEKGFLTAMRDHLQKLRPEHHCNRLLLPSTAGIIPESVICSECGRIMERFIMYQCCDD